MFLLISITLDFDSSWMIILCFLNSNGFYMPMMIGFYRILIPIFLFIYSSDNFQLGRLIMVWCFWWFPTFSIPIFSLLYSHGFGFKLFELLGHYGSDFKLFDLVLVNFGFDLMMLISFFVTLAWYCDNVWLRLWLV